MIKLKNYFLALAAVAVMFTLACGGGDDGPGEPTAEEQRLLDLAGTSGTTWTAVSITQDGSPANGFDNFSLTLRSNTSGQTFNSVDADPLIASSGPWAFNNGNLNQLVFNDDTDNVFNVSNLQTTNTPATVTLTVNFTNPSGGGAAGASGTYVFNLQAQ
jgi:hypothetical protein